MSLPSRLRVFAALELPPEWSLRLAEVIQHLGTVLPRGGVRWVRAEAIHLTLKFYGEVATDRLPDLQRSLERAAASARPFSLELGGLGVFPNPAHARVIWIGIAGDLNSLAGLQKAVEAASTQLGFEPEARGFTPHLTLGRVNGSLRPPERQKLAEALQDARFQRLGTFTAHTLDLIRSDLKPGGAVYTRLSAAPLGSRN